MKHFKKIKPLSQLALLAFAALCLVMLLLIHRNPGAERYAYAPYSFFLLQPEEVTEEAIPDYAGVRRSYTFTIPENGATTGARVMVWLRHTFAEVEIADSALRYNTGETDGPHVGHTPGNYWINIPVRPVYAGKTLTIALTPAYESARDHEPVFWLIGHDQLLTTVLLPQDAPMLILCFLALLIWFFLSLLAFVLPLPPRDRRYILLLGGIAGCTAVWKLTGLSSVALQLDILGWHKELWYLGALCYVFTLLLSLLFLRNLRASEAHPVGEVCFLTALGAALVLVILQLCDVLELHAWLASYGVGVAALQLIVLLSKRPTPRELLWTVPFLLALGLDLLMLPLRGSMHNTPFFLLWSIVNMSVLGFGFVRKAVLRERLLREQEQLLRDAKVAAMVRQIQPHFIYNTLTSIYVLCDEDPELAKQVIQDFTAYLQANFTALSANAPVPFSQELKHTKAYVGVEAIRFGDKLTVAYDAAFAAFRLPPLTLQPLVENAIKHGVGAGKGPTHILIRSYAEQGDAVVEIRDDGPGLHTPTADQTQIGLQNVRERLELMSHGSLTVRSPADDKPQDDARPGVVVTIRIPQSKSAEQPAPAFGNSSSPARRVRLNLKSLPLEGKAGAGARCAPLQRGYRSEQIRSV